MAVVTKATHKESPAKWKVREQLILASAVQRSGDQNWVSVSRCMKPFAEESRPPEFYSQKNCAIQYSVLLDKTSTPRRKRKEAGTPHSQEGDSTVETVEEQIVRHLTSKRIKELDKNLAKMKEDYMSLKKEIELIERGDLDDRLVTLLGESKSTSPETPVKKSQSPPVVPSVTNEPPPESVDKDKPHPLKVESNASPLKDTVKAEQSKGEEETTPTEPAVNKTVPLDKIQVPAAMEPGSSSVEDPKPTQKVPIPGPSSDSTNEGEGLKPKDDVPEAMETESVVEPTLEEGRVTPPSPDHIPIKEKAAPNLINQDPLEIKESDPVAGKGPEPREEGPEPEQKVKGPESITENPEVCSITKSESVEPLGHVTEGGPKGLETLVPGGAKTTSQEPIKQEPVDEVETERDMKEDEVKMETPKKEDSELKNSEREMLKEKNEEKHEATLAPSMDETKVTPQENTSFDSVQGERDPEKSDADVVTPPTRESKRKKRDSEARDEREKDNKMMEQQEEEGEEKQQVRKSKRKKHSTSSQVKVVEEDKVTESETEEEYKDETEEDEDYCEEEAPSPKPVTRRMRARRGTKRRDSRVSPLLKSSKSSEKGRRSARLEEKEEGSPAPPSGKKGRNTCTPTGRRRPNRRLKAEFRDSPKPEEESDEEPLSSAIPSPATSQGDNESETPQTLRTWKKTIMLVWRHAAQHKYANLFLHPVKEEDAPGYHEVILRPMDLSTIKKNIETGVIHTDIEFQRDIMLMFQNALMYNSSDHDVYKMAEEMRNDVLENIQEYQMTQLMVQSTSTAKALRSRDTKKTEGGFEEKGKKTPTSSEDTPGTKKTRTKPRPDD